MLVDVIYIYRLDHWIERVNTDWTYQEHHITKRLEPWSGIIPKIPVTSEEDSNRNLFKLELRYPSNDIM